MTSDANADESSEAAYIEWRNSHPKSETPWLRAAFMAGAASEAARTEAVARERDELSALFDMQHERTTKADALWRAESPVERELIVPDLGRLIDWLLSRADRAQYLTGEDSQLAARILFQEARAEQAERERRELLALVANVRLNLASHPTSMERYQSLVKTAVRLLDSVLPEEECECGAAAREPCVTCGERLHSESAGRIAGCDNQHHEFVKAPTG